MRTTVYQPGALAALRLLSMRPKYKIAFPGNEHACDDASTAHPLKYDTRLK